MMSALALILWLAALLPSLCASDGGYKVVYDGGSIANAKAGTPLKLNIESRQIRIIKGKIALATIAVSSVHEVIYGSDVHRRVGTAIGTPLVSTKSEDNCFGLTWDRGGNPGGAIFQADSGNLASLLAELKRARATAALYEASLAKLAMDEAHTVGAVDARLDAVNRLTDQALLAQVALAPTRIYAVGSPASDELRDKDSRVRKAAMVRLTDEQLLTKIALIATEETVGDDVPYIAATKLKNQSTLAKVALEAKAESARIEATDRLTDQVLLARIALNTSEEYTVRYAAVENLNDQSVFARIATNLREREDLRLAAEEKLTDESALELIALETVPLRFDSDAGRRRKGAIQKVTNQAVLLKISQDLEAGSYFRAVAVASLTDETALKMISEDQTLELNNPVRAIARLKLAIREPLIIAKLPGLRLSVSVDFVSAGYGQQYGPGGNMLFGENVSVSLGESTKILVKHEWPALFPKSVSTGYHPGLIEPIVTIEEPLKVLLQFPIFTPADLTDMSTSTLAEVRNAALAARRATR